MKDFNGFFIPPVAMVQPPKIELPEIRTPMQEMWAETQFEILKEQIQEFEKTLDADKQVGLCLTNFGQSVLMQVTKITYKDPVLMIFKGFVNGKEATLIQHLNQLNFLLTAIDKEPDKPRMKIGFGD